MQRTFDGPQSYTSYIISTFTSRDINPTGRETVPFQCELSKPFYATVRPNITWELTQPSGAVFEIVDSGKYDLIFRMQFSNISYLQIHLVDNTTNNGTKVRCIATNPLEPSEKVYSNEATLTISSKIKIFVN